MTPGEFTNSVRRTVLSNKNFNKLFGIGYNKTGTTTLERVLRRYGYALPNQQIQESRLTKQCFSTNYSELVSFVSRFDAFQDLPFSQGLVYVAADALFPNSKFVLTERCSDDWFRSLSTFHQKAFAFSDPSQLTEQDILDKFGYLYPGYMHENKTRLLSTFEGVACTVDWSKLYDKAYYVRQYEERNAAIKRYFMNAPEKLLVIDVTKEPTTERLCAFLGLPDWLIMEMPVENKT